jgi:hypothetical protein
MQIANLNENVLKVLEFFSKNRLPKLNLKKFKMPFVVGSEGAFYTGKNLFSRRAAIFANESTFKKIIKAYRPAIKKGLAKEAVIISASGEKDGPWEIKLAKKHGLKTTLLTCNANSTGAKLADTVLIFPKIAEPYTYNFSTYSGMMLSATNEDPQKIKKFVRSVKLPKNYGKYASYSFILPDDYLDICSMVSTKGDEIFGGRLPLRAFTSGGARHAKFVVRWEKELVVSIGGKNKYFGHPDHRWEIKLPEFSNIGTMLSLTYYLVGKIQEGKPPYFKNSIAAYCRDYGPKAYGKKEKFEAIVPGN